MRGPRSEERHGPDRSAVAAGPGGTLAARWRRRRSLLALEHWRRGPRVAYLLLALLLLASGAAIAQEPLPPPPVVPQDGGTIRGAVVGPNGPVSNVRVRISGPGGGGGVAVTSPDGTYELAVTKLGAYSVRVHTDGYRPEGVTVRVDVPGQEVLAETIQLVPSSLLVKVYNATTGKRLAGVQLVATPRAGEAVKGTTDAQGEYYFSFLRPGSYKLEAQLTGFVPLVKEVFIPEAIDTVTETFALVKGPSIPIAHSRQLYGTPQLPSSNVHAIYQDSTGIIWFATDNGVASFDGANFESSDRQGGALHALADSDVRAIAEFDGTHWFGTARGLRKLSDAGRVSTAGLEDDELRAVAVDAQGSAVLATSSGLFRATGDAVVQIAPGEFTSVSVDPTDGSLWVIGGAPAGLFRLVDGRLENAAAGTDPSIVGEPRAVVRTRSGDLLVGTSAGAYRVALNGAIVEPFLVGTFPNGVTAMLEDARGNLWFATDRGAVIYDTRRRVSDFVFQGERVNALMNDREGNLWFATARGAIRLDVYSFSLVTTSQGLLNNAISWIYPDPVNGRLWFVTGGGVQQSDGANYATYERLEPGTTVHHLLRDRAGRLWFATDDGVFREAPGTGDVPGEESPPEAIEQVLAEPALWLAEAHDGVVWAATQGGVGSFANRSFQLAPELAGHLATKLFAVGQDLWLATDRNAVCRRADASVEVVDLSRGVQGESVRWVAADPLGRVWLATSFGVEVLDGASLRKAENNGGIEPGVGVQSLLADSDGFMWVGLAGGSVRKIAFFDGGVIDTVIPGEQLSVVGSVVNAMARDASGTIWFATSNGAAQHSPVRVAPTVRSWVEVDGRPLQGDLVPSGQHTIRFHFHGVSMLGGLRYLYRLDGQGPWQLLPERAELERDVTFERLPAGPHRLELRAINRDLYGINAPPVEMAIHIDVPLWRKPWFYGMGLIALLGLGTVAGLGYRYKTREYTLPDELRTYVPIEPNPYIVGNPIRNERMFFGREDDFRYVRTKLEGASQGVVVVLCGERRAGKSSILYQVLNGRLGSRFIPVFVDMQEMVVASDREFFHRFARVIAEAVHIDRAEVDAYGFKDLTLNPYHQFVDFLDNVLTRIEDRTLLVLVDEYELLEAKVEEGRLDPDIFLFLAGLIDSKERLSFIFTGSRRLEERDRRYWREMLRRSFFRKVGFLSANDARRLVYEPVEGRVVFGRNVVDRIVRLTAGQPFYTQVVCQTAVDYLNEHSRNALGMRDLDRVVAEIVDHPLPQMIYSWEALSPDEKVVLSLLAEDLESVGDQGWSTAGDICSLVTRLKAPVDLSENTIHLTLEELFRREVLEKNAIEGYRFRIDVLRLWIRRSHSIWQVIKER